MSTRVLPPVGGGAPVLIAAGIMAPASSAAPGDPANPLELTLTGSPDAERNGRRVVDVIAATCSRAVTPEVLDDVATLEFFFSSVVRRVAEFHALMEELVAGGRFDAVRKIVDEPGRVGRPREFPSLVALVEAVLADHPAWSRAKAIEFIDANYRGARAWSLPSVARMKNVDAAFRRLYEMWRAPIFAPAEILTAQPWLAPQGVDDPAVFVVKQPAVAVGQGFLILYDAATCQVRIPKKGRRDDEE